MKDLYFYMICPKCYQQDHFSWPEFKHYVLDEQLEEKNEGLPTPPYRMEGEYPCPYGCEVQMQLFAIGTREEVDKKSDELFYKYFKKMSPKSLYFTMQRISEEEAKKIQEEYNPEDRELPFSDEKHAVNTDY